MIPNDDSKKKSGIFDSNLWKDGGIFTDSITGIETLSLIKK
jgi:hypothetical protein